MHAICGDLLYSSSVVFLCLDFLYKKPMVTYRSIHYNFVLAYPNRAVTYSKLMIYLTNSYIILFVIKKLVIAPEPCMAVFS